MKKIFVTGNVGRDPDPRYDTLGNMFVSFSLAVTIGPKDNQKTDWLEISANGRTAETVLKWVKKGSKLLVEGTPSANAYINKEGKAVGILRVSASNIEFIGSRERSEEAGALDADYEQAPSNEPVSTMQPSGLTLSQSLQADDTLK